MTDIKKIVYLGASTSFYEVYSMIQAINKLEKKYEIIAILDDNKNMHGKAMNNIFVKGPLASVCDYPDAYFIFGIGSMKTRLIRQKIINDLNIEISRFETIIHPSAVIDETAKIAPGCIIHPGVCIGNDAVIDPFSIIAVNSAIGPYVHLESFSMITSLVVILTGAKIGKSVFVGSCSCVTENVHIGAGSMIGAGTVVSRDLDKGCFFLGNPGRLINKIELPLYF